MSFNLGLGERAEPLARDPHRRVWSHWLVVLLLFCFVAQGTAVQSHVHFVGHASPAFEGSVAVRLTAAPSGNGDSPANCPLCQEAAMAGAYVLPQAPTLPPPPAPALRIAVAAMAAFTLLTPSLGWLSRAPPE